MRQRVMPARPCIAAAALGFVGAFAAGEANANGCYPAVKHIVFDSMDPSHFVTTTTFGLFESRDRGCTYFWRCEAVLGVMGDQDELVAITVGGTLAAAVSNNL